MSLTYSTRCALLTIRAESLSPRSRINVRESRSRENLTM